MSKSDESGGPEAGLLEALSDALVTPKLTESRRRILRERVLEAAARTAPPRTGMPRKS